MAVITRDALIEGIRRDAVFEWLSDPEHHDRFLQDAFEATTRKGEKQWARTMKVSPKTRVVGYELLKADGSHGGRRVLCKTTGKRTTGKLHYSLRTVKPSSNTMVTLHADYEPGGLLGRALDMAGLRESLESRYQKLLDNMVREILKDQ